LEWTLKSGEFVVDRFNSHLHTGLEGLLKEALGKIESEGRPFMVEEVNFGRVVGETVCVETSDLDQIVFAQRPSRFGISRFVMNRQPAPCSALVVILKRAEEGFYILISAFVGRKPEPEPWDRNATERSVEFWSGHALIWGQEPVIQGSETTVCPW